MKNILLINVIIFCAALLIVKISPAQTMVCTGDTVVLVLNGYKQGSSLWLESSDLMTWVKATGTSYNDSLVITPTTTMYYRAKVTDGSCAKVNSDTIVVPVRPALPTPTAKAASDITAIFFDANWSPSAGATTYYLDVATDNGFASFVDGYNNLMVNNKTTYTVSGVLPHTTYYYRVRVYDDSCGRISGNSNMIHVTTTSYPVECSVMSICSGGPAGTGNILDSRDNKTYKTVQIGTQCWMAQNLNIGKMIPGSSNQLPGVDNQDTSIEKYCYGNNLSNCNIYGGLYRWKEMMAYGLSDSVAPGPQGICPAGWHIPVDMEWTCLEKTVGSSTTAGGKLKDTTHWNNPNTGASNASGFTAFGAGRHENITGSIFEGIGDYTVWQTATDSPTYAKTTAWFHSVSKDDAGAYHDDGSFEDNYAYSVRCVKN